MVEEKAVEQQFGMVFMESGNINPTRLKVNPRYQRLEEIGRTKKLSSSFDMMPGGFDPSYPVVLNEKNEVVNGGHRVRVSINKKITSIPYVKYRFTTINEEIRYFNHCQIGTKGMNSRDILFSRNIMKTPYAKIVYYICDQSLLKGQHNLRMTHNQKGNRQTIKVENICYLVNYLALQRKSSWSVNNINDLDAAAKVIMESDELKKDAVERVDEFLHFFFESFEYSTLSSDLKYREHFFLATMLLFIRLKQDDRFFKNYEKIISSLKRFSVTEYVTKNHKEKIVEILLEHLNKNRKKENYY